MARFYQTALPEFIDGTIYQQPWELAAQAIQTQDLRNDQLIAEADLLEGQLGKIQHLNFDEENQRVKDIQSKYDTRIKGLVDSIYENPLEYRRQMPQLRELQREYQNDLTSGDIYQIQSRYSDYQKWLEDNKDIQQANPRLFNRLNKHFYDDVVARASEAPDARFQGQQIINRPDIIKGYREVFENIKANSRTTSDGKYIYQNKEISEQELADIAWNTLASDPNFEGYAQQMGVTLGDSGYFDQSGRMVSPFVYMDEQGQVYSPEQYQTLTAEEKGRARRVLNNQSAFYSDLAAVVGTYGFRETEMDEDQYGLQSQQGAIRSQLSAQGAQQDAVLEDLRQRGREDLLRLRYELMGDRDQEQYKMKLKLLGQTDPDATETLDNLEGKESIGILGKPDASYQSDAQLVQNMRKPGQRVSQDGQPYFTAQPGTVAYAAQQRMFLANEQAYQKHKDQRLTLSNGKVVEGQEYLDWLGEREHSLEAASQFLQQKRLSIPGNRSTAEKTADEITWFPGFMRSNFGADANKLYQLGEQFAQSRQEWYESYTSENDQLPFHPVIDKEVSQAVLREALDYNPQAFNLIAPDGSMVGDKAEMFAKVDRKQPVYVTASNSHSEMAMRVMIEGKPYYIAPSSGNEAEINLMTGLTMLGVDPESQYYKEVRDRRVNSLQSQLEAVGPNSKGTKSIVTELYGNPMSIEVEGNTVHIRRPDQALSEPPARTFNNMIEMFNTLANMKTGTGQQVGEVEVQASRSTGPAEN